MTAAQSRANQRGSPRFLTGLSPAHQADHSPPHSSPLPVSAVCVAQGPRETKTVTLLVTRGLRAQAQALQGPSQVQMRDRGPAHQHRAPVSLETIIQSHVHTAQDTIHVQGVKALTARAPLLRKLLQGTRQLNQPEGTSTKRGTRGPQEEQQRGDVVRPDNGQCRRTSAPQGVRRLWVSLAALGETSCSESGSKCKERHWVVWSTSWRGTCWAA